MMSREENDLHLTCIAALLHLARRAGPLSGGPAHHGEMQTFRTFLNAVLRGAKASQWIVDGAEKGMKNKNRVNVDAMN